MSEPMDPGTYVRCAALVQERDAALKERDAARQALANTQAILSRAAVERQQVSYHLAVLEAELAERQAQVQAIARQYQERVDDLKGDRDDARAVACNLARRAQQYPELTDLRKELLLARQENPWLEEALVS